MNDVSARIICVTGGIGAGKSIVSTILRLKGFVVYDCDSAARRLMETDGILKEGLVSLLGNGVYMPDGSLDRKMMASIIFSDDNIRGKVNRLVHSAVREDMERVSERNGLIFVETAIPVTSGIDKMAFSVWMIDAPERLRLERACGRDNVPAESVIARMRSQREEFSGLPASRTVRIINDGETPLLPVIDRLIENLIN